MAFTEALTVFADPLAAIFDDPDHSSDEMRELIIGHSVNRRVAVVSFTERAAGTRIISALLTTPRERHAYEEHSKKRC